MNLGGGKRKGPKSSLTGKHRNLILRGQSLGIVKANVRGIGTNHPIMDILGVPESRPTAQHNICNWWLWRWNIRCLEVYFNKL